MGCSISSGEIKIPGGIIYEGKHTILGADPEIPIPVFLIVNIKRHVNSFSELNREERNEIGDVIAYEVLNVVEKTRKYFEEHNINE